MVYGDCTCIQNVLSEFLQLAASQVPEKDQITLSCHDTDTVNIDTQYQNKQHSKQLYHKMKMKQILVYLRWQREDDEEQNNKS